MNHKWFATHWQIYVFYVRKRIHWCILSQRSYNLKIRWSKVNSGRTYIMNVRSGTLFPSGDTNRKYPLKHFHRFLRLALLIRTLVQVIAGISKSQSTYLIWKIGHVKRRKTGVYYYESPHDYYADSIIMAGLKWRHRQMDT